MLHRPQRFCQSHLIRVICLGRIVVELLELGCCAFVVRRRRSCRLAVDQGPEVNNWPCTARMRKDPCDVGIPRGRPCKDQSPHRAPGVYKVAFVADAFRENLLADLSGSLLALQIGGVDINDRFPPIQFFVNGVEHLVALKLVGAVYKVVGDQAESVGLQSVHGVLDFFQSAIDVAHGQRGPHAKQLGIIGADFGGVLVGDSRHTFP